MEHSAADERLLAVARLVGAGVLFMAAPPDDVHGPLVDVLVSVYVAHAALVAIISGLHPGWPPRHAGILHVVDLLWGAVATGCTGGAASSFSPMFSFVLFSSAFHWGLRGTIRDASIIGAVALVQGLFVPPPATHDLHQLRHAAVRLAYLGIGIGVLFGVLLDRQFSLRSQALAIADLVSRISGASRLQPALRETLSRMLELFEARHVIVIIENKETGTVDRWRADARGSGSVSLSHMAVSRHDRAAWVFAEACHAVACELRRPTREGSAARTADTLGECGCHANMTMIVPSAIANASSWGTLTRVSVASAGVWTGHVCVLDPALRPGGEARLRLLQTLVQQIVPPLATLHLLGRLRSRAEAVERSRLSRELHDGALPSLAGLEMRVEALRLVAENVAPGLAQDLREVRDHLHEEAIDLRALMQRLRSPSVDARHLRGELEDLIARFARATGIGADLDWSAEPVEPPRHQCTELVRIVQEALFNVQRHSGANRVWVRVLITGRAWSLRVDDNGCGLGFSGSLTHEELETQRYAPRVIWERVGALAGRLDLASGPCGTRLYITVPFESAE